MTNQLFKEVVELKKFFNFLINATKIEQSPEYDEKYVLQIDKTIYKKLIYLNLYDEFLKSIETNYFYSKRHYVNKNQTYNTF